MITIGNPTTFAFEIHSDNLSDELGEIYLIVSSKRVSGRNPVYVPTFVSAISGFLQSQKSKSQVHDFSSMMDREVFQLFHRISETDQEARGITPSDVFDCYRLHSIDDAVDDWEIYVFDSQGEKHIVCRPIVDRADLSCGGDGFVSTAISRQGFIDTVAEFIGVISRARMRDEPT